MSGEFCETSKPYIVGSELTWKKRPKSSKIDTKGRNLEIFIIHCYKVQTLVAWLSG